MSAPVRLAIVGGGLAGLAAADAALEAGMEVTLFESRQSLGGRVASFVDPTSGAELDHCQHAAMGCCTRWLEFCRRLHVSDCFVRHRRLHFIVPGGQRIDFAPAVWLPSPLHVLKALLGLRFLSWVDRAGIIRAAMALRRGPPDPSATAAEWLAAQAQSPRAVERFWTPVLVSALGDRLERVSAAAMRQVIVEGLLLSHAAHEVILPLTPLAEVYDRRVRAALLHRGAAIKTACRVDRLEQNEEGRFRLSTRDGSAVVDCCIVAVPWWQVRGLLDEALWQRLPLESAERLSPRSIAAVHLWFDRPFTPLPHAVLLDGTGQWVFQPKHLADPNGPAYYQVVVSAADDVLSAPRNELVHTVTAELAAAWPAAPLPPLRDSRVTAHRRAVFSPAPGVDELRPPQRTPVRGLALAGDWTATGWPATMESAVRSGYAAVAALLRQD